MREEDNIIEITLGNGHVVTWKKEEYTDYHYDGKCFVIIRDSKWVAFYVIDRLISIIVKD